MKLYHGTSLKNLPAILREGLRPRCETSHAGNWKHTVDSCDSAVYLTDAFAGHFAFSAVSDEEGDEAVILEIDTDRLNPSRLVPDEDFLAHLVHIDPDKAEMYGIHAPIGASNLNALSEYFRDYIEDYPEFWEDSLRILGTCAYAGTIPPEAITKIVKFGESRGAYIHLFDNSVNPVAYKFTGATTRNTLRIVMGYESELEPDPMSEMRENITKMKEVDRVKMLLEKSSITYHTVDEMKEKISE